MVSSKVLVPASSVVVLEHSVASVMIDGYILIKEKKARRKNRGFHLKLVLVFPFLLLSNPCSLFSSLDNSLQK